MQITTVSSREFNQNVSQIKHAALHGPVFITDRGHPAHVLLSIEAYEEITRKQESIVDLLAMPDNKISCLRDNLNPISFAKITAFCPVINNSYILFHFVFLSLYVIVDIIP